MHCTRRLGRVLHTHCCLISCDLHSYQWLHSHVRKLQRRSVSLKWQPGHCLLSNSLFCFFMEEVINWVLNTRWKTKTEYLFVMEKSYLPYWPQTVTAAPAVWGEADCRTSIAPCYQLIPGWVDAGCRTGEYNLLFPVKRDFRLGRSWLYCSFCKCSHCVFWRVLVRNTQIFCT